MLNIDEDAREADWVKAMGNMHTDPVQPQGGTFSSGSSAVLPRNNHGNAETVVGFCGFHGLDHGCLIPEVG